MSQEIQEIFAVHLLRGLLHSSAASKNQGSVIKIRENWSSNAMRDSYYFLA